MRKFILLVFLMQVIGFIGKAHAEKNQNLEIQVKSTSLKKLLGQ